MAAPASSQLLKHLKIAPKEAHQATVIFLHGLGDSGRGWTPVAKHLWSSFPHVKWILPHAPSIPISLNGGMPMPGWFDIATLDKLTDSQHDDEAGLLRSVAQIDALIQAEVDSGIPERRIVVAGFSQGGAVSVLTGLTTRRDLAGVGVLSSWVPLSHKVQSMMGERNKDIPIFWGHGTDDPVVQYIFGQMSIELLTKKLGYPLLPSGQTFARPGLRFESYLGLPHSSSPKEIDDFKGWLTEALK